MLSASIALASLGPKRYSEKVVRPRYVTVLWYAVLACRDRQLSGDADDEVRIHPPDAKSAAEQGIACRLPSAGEVCCRSNEIYPGHGYPCHGARHAGLAFRGFRLGSQVVRGGDCVVDTLGDENVQSGRAAFRFLINEKVEFNLIGDLTVQRQKGPADKYTVMDADQRPERLLERRLRRAGVRQRRGVEQRASSRTTCTRTTAATTIRSPTASFRTSTIWITGAWPARSNGSCRTTSH